MSFKQRALDWVGYDPQVVEAASSKDALQSLTHDIPGAARNYVKRLFPFTRWILHYNLTWAVGDLIAGLTVGLVVVPQSMSYAKIATLPVEYGLYSSFVGVMIYAVFATSKDVTIGPVAVMSLIVSRVIQHVQSAPGGMAYSAPVIATALAFITGFIVLGIGLLRLGFIIEFIPAPSVSGFMTGSAISIAAGQVANLMGYANKFNTREATYKVIINSFKFLPSTKLDAAFGLSGLTFLYAVRYICGRIEARTRNPVIKRATFFANTLRTAFVIIILTVISWAHLRHKKVAAYDISILKTVPAGFEHMGQPKGINADLMSRLASQLPVSVIVLLLEHIAISKSFGRVNNYKIDPNQELIAIGVTNTIGTVFNAYPATGSFSRSAIKSKAGVRTPLAGWITGICVVVALYGLTSAFYWIPNAALAAVIIHAVGDLIASPRQVYGFWKVSPLEAIIWFAAVMVTIFSSIENGIYTSVAASAALLLYRIARPRGQFLGRVRLHPEPEDGEPSSEPHTHRDVYVPVRPDGVRNPLIIVEPPPPGVVIYRFDEAFLYPNAAYYVDIIVDYAKLHTRSGQDFSSIKPGDRPWNDPGPLEWRWGKRGNKSNSVDDDKEPVAEKPLLHAVVFDFASVSNLDTTAIQNLVDLRRMLERYAAQEVEFHFANILSPWIKRALLAGGFGTGKLRTDRPLEIAAVVPAGTEHVVESQHSRYFQRRFPASPPVSPPNGPTGAQSDASSSSQEGKFDLESQLEQNAGRPAPTNYALSAARSNEEAGPVVSPLYARFHLDLPSAVAAAVGKDDW